MSEHSQVQTMAAYWRKVCATLPAIALIGGGIAVTGPGAAPPNELQGANVSKNSPAIVVPDVAMEPPSTLTTPGTPSAVPVPTSADPLAVPAPLTPALVLPAGTVPGSSTPVTLDTAGIPIRALEGYRSAVTLVNAADPACKIDWALVAAIGRVESDHARFGGNQLDSAGVAQPGIIGIPLDGSNGTARIMDSDGGQLDRDTVFDRAVGPMQFIPGTWAGAGADADGDGVKNPQDIADASTAAAIYLCSGPGDLTQPAALDAAIMRYNASASYVRTVISIAEAYRQGVSALPASDLPASSPPATDPTAADISAADRSAPTMALAAKAITATQAIAGQPATTIPAGAQPATGPGAVPPNATAPPAAVPASPPAVTPTPGTQVPATPPAVTPTPVTQVPVTPVPVTPVPVTPVPVTPVPVTPVPVTPVPVTPVPVTPVPVTPVPVPAPDPCLPPDPNAPIPTPTPTIIDPTAPALPIPAPVIPCLTPTPTPTP